MLCSEALKAAKTAFVLVAGLVGAYAYAQFDETPPDVFAAESVTAKDKETTVLGSTSTKFPLIGKLKTALPPGTYYLGLSLDSKAEGGRLEFAQDLALATTASSSSFSIYEGSEILVAGSGASVHTTATIAHGGEAKSNYVVYQFANGAQIPNTANVRFNSPLQVRGKDGGSYTATMRVFRSYFAAIDNDGDSDIGQAELTKTILLLTKALTVDVTDPQTAVADVAAGFKRFTATDGDSKGEMGRLATVKVDLATTFDHDGDEATGALTIKDAATNAEITQAGVLGSASVTVSGDLSVGMLQVGDATGKLLDSEGKEVKMTGKDEDGDDAYSDTDKAAAAKVRIPVTGTADLVLNVEGNEMRIPEGSYTADVAVALKVANADAAAHQMEGRDAGSIKRNGTSVNIAYVTVSDVYNQRLVLVNHGASDADFQIHSLVVESGMAGMLTLGDGAPAGLSMADDSVVGTIMAGQQVVIRMRDIVSIAGDGSPRGALTVDLSASAADASVATTQVNLRNNDGSADTVSYH